MRDLRIAYLCDISPLDRNLYSGGNTRIFEALGRHVGDVTILSQGWHAAEPLRKLITSTPEALNLRLRWRAQLAMSRVIAQGIKAELDKGDFDVLFGAYSFQSMAGLKLPDHMAMAYTADATQTVYRASEVGQAHGRHFGFGHLLDGWVERRERDLFRSADLLLWPSQWLMDAASERYGLVDGQAHLLPWGANIEDPGPPEPRAISRDDPLRLLLIGRNWFAKGGPIAFDTMQALRARGVDAQLTVIGCVPPDFHVNDWVTVHPQLDKAVPEELADFKRELARAHFLVQPSFESFGFAFCEASAYGLPSLCLRVGGVPIRDAINGHALPVGSGPAEFAERISSYLDNPDGYVSLTKSTRQEYENHLNWDAWGKGASELLHDALDRKRRAQAA